MATTKDNSHMNPMTGNGAVKDGNGIARESVKITPKPTQKKVIARSR